ncbi:MAG: hypothetical protein ABI539_04235 [Acidobacteriota bacterium]
MKNIAIIASIVLFFVAVSDGQVRRTSPGRTVTNVELEKFKQKRLDAERDYRNNYAAYGMPSPEDLAARNQKDSDERLALAEQLRQARLEKERNELERSRLEMEQRRENFVNSIGYPEIYQGGVYPGYYGGSSFWPYRTGFRSRSVVPIRGQKNRLLPVTGFPLMRITPVGVVPAGTNGFGTFRGVIRSGRFGGFGRGRH